MLPATLPAAAVVRRPTSSFSIESLLDVNKDASKESKYPNLKRSFQTSPESNGAPQEKIPYIRSMVPSPVQQLKEHCNAINKRHFHHQQQQHQQQQHLQQQHHQQQLQQQQQHQQQQQQQHQQQQQQQQSPSPNSEHSGIHLNNSFNRIQADQLSREADLIRHSRANPVYRPSALIPTKHSSISTGGPIDHDPLAQHMHSAGAGGAMLHGLVGRMHGYPIGGHHPCLPTPGSPQCPPQLHIGLTNHCRDESIPYFTWLLSRHGSYFNHRLHNPGSDAAAFLFPFRKPKRIRTAFSPSQLLQLEEAFGKNHYVVGQERKDLAASLNLTETQVKVWFQNRRTKHKRVQPGEEGADNPDGVTCSEDEEDGEEGEEEEEEYVDVDSPNSEASCSSFYRKQGNHEPSDGCDVTFDVTDANFAVSSSGTISSRDLNRHVTGTIAGTD